MPCLTRLLTRTYSPRDNLVALAQGDRKGLVRCPGFWGRIIIGEPAVRATKALVPHLVTSFRSTIEICPIAIARFFPWLEPDFLLSGVPIFHLLPESGFDFYLRLSNPNGLLALVFNRNIEVAPGLS